MHAPESGAYTYTEYDCENDCKEAFSSSAGSAVRRASHRGSIILTLVILVARVLIMIGPVSGRGSCIGIFRIGIGSGPACLICLIDHFCCHIHDMTVVNRRAGFRKLIICSLRIPSFVTHFIFLPFMIGLPRPYLFIDTASISIKCVQFVTQSGDCAVKK